MLRCFDFAVRPVTAWIVCAVAIADGVVISGVLAAVGGVVVLAEVGTGLVVMNGVVQ